MAKKNRTEILSEVTTKFVPTLTLTTHKSFLDDDLINSAVYEKDVIASETPGGGAVVIDYADKDTAIVTIAANLSVSFTNIENGAVKYLHVTKAAANTISFAGATDTSPRKTFINTTPTIVIYQVFNKNGVISVNSINIDNDTTATLDTDLDNISGGLYKKVIDLGFWNMQISSSIDVAHGIADHTKIRAIFVMIIGDDGLTMIPLNGKFNAAAVDPGGVETIFALLVRIQRLAGGIFDDSLFNSAIINRGWMVIEYLP